MEIHIRGVILGPVHTVTQIESPKSLEVNPSNLNR